MFSRELFFALEDASGKWTRLLEESLRLCFAGSNPNRTISNKAHHIGVETLVSESRQVIYGCWSQKVGSLSTKSPKSSLANLFTKSVTAICRVRHNLVPLRIRGGNGCSRTRSEYRIANEKHLTSKKSPFPSGKRRFFLARSTLSEG